MTDLLLETRSLGVEVPSGEGWVPLLRDVGLSLREGEVVGLVGASGAGKSTLAQAMLRLLPAGGRFTSGSVLQWRGSNLTAASEGHWRAVRGRGVAMVPQEPVLALTPSRRVGDLLAEGIVAHGLADAREAAARVESVLGDVGIAGPDAAMRRYPHQFSGGQRQRLLIAAALVLEPRLIIADEPTTALDPTLQAQVLDLLEAHRKRSGCALLLISHDLDVLGERAARVLVLDGGRIVEDAPTSILLRAPASDAARRLVAARRAPRRNRGGAVPEASAPAAESTAPEPSPRFLVAEDIVVRYRERRATQSRRTTIDAVAGVSLELARGEALGLVGESGCGKTSLARALLRLGPIDEGRVLVDAVDLSALRHEPMRRLRRRLQWIPQDAGASLTPDRRVDSLVAEGLVAHGLAEGSEAMRRATTLLASLGLPWRVVTAPAGTLSTGERQRVAIARALALEPDLLICDEPVASVDAETRGALLDLLADLRQSRRLALLVISHDLDAVRRLTDRVAVMYAGRIVEEGPTAAVLSDPRMPYTTALLAAEPTGDPDRRAATKTLRGEVSRDLIAADGCAFYGRCQHPARDAACATSRPALETVTLNHSAACSKLVRA